MTNNNYIFLCNWLYFMTYELCDLAVTYMLCLLVGSKLTYGYEHGSSTSSLPPVGLTTPTAPAAVPAPRDPATAAAVATAGGAPRLLKEPERRHSLYDSASRCEKTL